MALAMPHTRVAEMRIRVVKLMELADRAYRNGRGRQAAMILDLLDSGVLRYEEALAMLKRIVARW